jgi:hypothetical protein
VFSDFELLRAYVEAKNVASADFHTVQEVAKAISQGRRRGDLGENERRVADLLWHLGLAVASVDRGRLEYRPTRQLIRIARGDAVLFALRLARWTPMRLLLKFLVHRGGQTSEEEVEVSLGGLMEKVTARYLPVLRLAYPKLKKPVKKPYNKHVVSAVLFRLGSEVGLLRRERKAVELTEFAKELLVEEPVEVVRTGPNSPVILAAVASAVASGGEVHIASPWIDVEVASALAELLKGKVIVVSRPPRDKRHREALKMLNAFGEVLCYGGLHTKAVAGASAVVTSANLVKTSLLRNIETGVYYRETPTTLRLHLEEIAASGRPCL